jgi:hypothetical protein
MSIRNIGHALLWANSSVDSSVTIARSGGRGWAFAEVQLAWVSSNATARAWISATRTQPSHDQILVGISPDPGGASISLWLNNCLSVTFSLRVQNGYAAAIAKLSPWA